MKTNVVKSTEFRTSHWSGGDTTQIYIYPPHSDYDSRDFLFRISSAVVNDYESVFTKLDNIKRNLMVIEGNIRLEHIGFHTAVLSEYDVDVFMGDWETRCFGCCKDYNMMIKGHNEGDLYSLNVNEKGQRVELKENNIYVIYSFDTDLEINEIGIKNNTAVIISDISNGDFINFLGNGNVIISRVNIKKEV